MNIKTSNKKKLFESSTVQKVQKIQSNNDKTIEDPSISGPNIEKIKKLVDEVFGVKSKQFVFDCGIMMASLNYNDPTSRFCMMYHFENTDNFEQFTESVTEFIKASGYSLTDHDIKRMKTDYNFKVTGKVEVE
jgi:hypothetical protein